MKKKLLLTLGSLAAFAAPIGTVVACGGSKNVTPPMPKRTPEQIQQEKDENDLNQINELKRYFDSENADTNDLDMLPTEFDKDSISDWKTEFFYNGRSVEEAWKDVAITFKVLETNNDEGKIKLSFTLTKGTQHISFEKEYSNFLTTAENQDKLDEKWFTDTLKSAPTSFWDSGTRYLTQPLKTTLNDMTFEAWKNNGYDNKFHVIGMEKYFNNFFKTENADDSIIIDKAKFLNTLRNFAGINSLSNELNDQRLEIVSAKYKFSFQTYLDKQLEIKKKYPNVTLDDGAIGVNLKLKRGNIIKNDVILTIWGFKPE